MLIISEQTLTGFDEEHAAALPHRLHLWWREHIDAAAEPQVTERLVFAHRGEFQLVGVREEEDQFLFLYARALMPEMGDHDYLETMDAIFTRVPLAERIAMIAAIARKYGHRG